MIYTLFEHSKKDLSDANPSSIIPIDGASRSSSYEGSDHSFVLLEEWKVNKHYSLLSKKWLRKIWSRFQISSNVPIRLANVGERFYSHNGERIGFYDSSFVSGLRISLSCLAKKLVRRLGIEVSQLNPNAWRTFVGA